LTASDTNHHGASWLQVLNLLLFQLTGQPYDDPELEFLAIDEQLVDIGDDLCERPRPPK